MQLKDDSTSLGFAITAMLSAKAWIALTLAVRHLGAAALRHVISAVQIDGASHSSIDYPDELFAVLWVLPDIAAELIAQNEVAAVPLNMIAAEADPRSHHFRYLGLGPWLIATESKMTFASPFRDRSASVFYLTAGLSRLSELSPVLIARSFSRVYAAAEGDKLEPLLLRRLESSLSWYAVRSVIA
jgi:hypothetical protein